MRFSLRGLKSKISKHMKKLPISSLCVLKELEASLRMGIYEDRQIHTKTGFRPIKLQESRSGPHTNRMPSNYLLFTNWVQGPYQEIQAQGFSYSPSLRGLFGKPRACISWYGTSTQLVNSLLHDPFLESE